MAQAERWTFKILSLPVFDRTFAEAIAQSPLVNPTFVIALGAESAGEFTSIVSRICESFDTKVTDVLCSETDKLEQFWSLIIASEKLFLEASTQQLGFGLCETRARSEGNLPHDELRKEALIKALVSKPTAPNKRLKPDPVQPSSIPRCWIKRMQRKLAGLHALKRSASGQERQLSSFLWKINRRISLKMI